MRVHCDNIMQYDLLTPQSEVRDVDGIPEVEGGGYG